jgi:uncharacterized protein
MILSRTAICIVALSFTSAAFADVQSGLAALDAGNVAQAAADFQKAFEENDADGAFYLGRLFEMGVGTEKDTSRAANLYAAGAEKGSVMAMNRLGLLYLEGTTLLRDYAEAAKQFCKAADLGDQNGQLNCALMLKDGKGVAADDARAMTYLEAASGQGNIAAKNILAQLYISGEAGAANPAKAMELYKETAEQGNALGLFELAKAAMSPEGGAAPNLVMAYMYANLAAVRQFDDAAKLRDELEAQMTTEQVVEAQTKSQEWTAARIAAAAAPASQ